MHLHVGQECGQVQRNRAPRDVGCGSSAGAGGSKTVSLTCQEPWYWLLAGHHAASLSSRIAWTSLCGIWLREEKWKL